MQTDRMKSAISRVDVFNRKWKVGTSVKYKHSENITIETKTSALAAVKNMREPVVFLHGVDAYVHLDQVEVIQ